jgi:phosphoglycerate dehydrogenase-like enzyme
MRHVRVLLTKPFFPEDLAYLRSRLSDGIELITPPQYTVEALAKAVEDDIHVLLGDLIAKPVLDRATGLELIQVPWTGVDRMDFSLLRQYRVTVCNSHSNAGDVAEYAISLMLAAAKWIPFHDRYLRKGQWRRPQRGMQDSFFPSDSIGHKTATFIGYGAIAQHITRFLAGFSMTFLAVCSTARIPPPPPLAKLVSSSNLLDAVKEADFLFITLPLTPKTRRMINESVFRAMRPTAYLINVSRGEIVDEEAFYTALHDRWIAGAAVDTWYNYPKPNDPVAFPSAHYQFHELDNLVLSPHRAGMVRGALSHLDGAIENLNRLAAGRPLINVVNLDAGY